MKKYEITYIHIENKSLAPKDFDAAMHIFLKHRKRYLTYDTCSNKQDTQWFNTDSWPTNNMLVTTNVYRDMKQEFKNILTSLGLPTDSFIITQEFETIQKEK